MTGRIVTLNAAKGGINRQRVRGGADPNTLYDLENGHVDASGVIRSRPGVDSIVILPANTKGLCAYDGKLIVFSHVPQTVPASTPTVACEVLVNPDDTALTLRDIHFAAPILGYLYVVAEFSDGSVWHYWLQRVDAWQASKTYLFGALVRPTVANGYSYKATRLGTANPTWTPNVDRALNDVVEPTEPNGYKYTVTSVAGADPRSGATEPKWPAEAGATVIEDTSYDGSGLLAGTTDNTSTTLPVAVVDRYENQFWNDGSSGAPR